MAKQKVTRGNASQFFVAGELCRRGYSAVVTLGNTPNTDVLCSDLEGTRFVHIQVKTFRPGDKTCAVGKKAEKSYTGSFFWVLAGIPEIGSQAEFLYYVIPCEEMARNVAAIHSQWLNTPGANGRVHKENSFRSIDLPPGASINGWDVSGYLGRWDLIETILNS